MKQATIGAALLGLLFVGCATSRPQDPTVSEPVARQAALPKHRDVLRGKVGQQCDVEEVQGTCTLFFGRQDDAKSAVSAPSLGDFYGMLNARGLESSASERRRVLEQAQGRLAEELFLSAMGASTALGRRTEGVTVAAVGEDFVQLREADGTERYVPLSRVDVVVMPAAK